MQRLVRIAFSGLSGFPTCGLILRIALAVTFAFPCTAIAQENPGFEAGMEHWMGRGSKGNITLADHNAFEGRYCSVLKPGSILVQRIAVVPLSVLQFGMQVKCDNVNGSIRSFIQFFDSLDRELLTYKGAPIHAQTWQATGNYTEAPPFTTYADIGVETDAAAEGLAFADALTCSLNIGSPVKKYKPLCNLDQYLRPFWKTDTVYDETVLMLSEKDQPATGRLLFVPDKILSVRSFDGVTTYHAGADFRLEKNVLFRCAHSRMPFRADTSFDTRNDLAWYNLQSQWIVVTYTHKDAWKDPLPVYQGVQMPRTISKLKNRLPLRVVAFGMSITRGLDVSGFDTVPPYMPSYVELFVRALKNSYHDNGITLYNAGLPGGTVSWGAAYAANYINPLKPDVVIIDFGMNDFWRTTPAEFSSYIDSIIRRVKIGNPHVEFLLLGNMDFDPAYIQDSDRYKNFYVTNMQGYPVMLKQLAAKGVITLDMLAISDRIYTRKKAKDCLVNPLHPNDYLARWYAQCMAALFIPDRQKR